MRRQIVGSGYFDHLEGEYLKVTQKAAIAAARAAGHGDKNLADQAAVSSMREALASITGVTTTIKIGEGERDNAPMLYIGEKIGSGKKQVDLAVDPLENTNASANLGPNSVCVLAASTPGGLISATDGYMDKLIVGPKLAHVVNIDMGVKHNILKIATYLKRSRDDLTITVLDRPRNAQLIREIRETGARAQLIPDGDLMPGVFACISGSSTHAVMGIGASPEGVISATAVKLLGGSMQARFKALNLDDEDRLRQMGINRNKIYTEQDLAPGDELIMCATAVTVLTTATKCVLEGVSFFGGGVKVNSMLVTKNGIEIIKATYKIDPEEFERGNSEYRI